VTQFRGDIHLSAEERAAPPTFADITLPERFWIIVAGGKYDFTAKWWNPASYQAIVDHFRDRIAFVQVGEAGHWHPPLDGVVNVVGNTSTRELIRLMHFADGVVCPVTLAMHLAAAVPLHNGLPNRACVVIAGGREPPHWEAYPGHQYLHTVGQLDCCATGGCWKSRCQTVGDGDAKDRRDRCERPVQIKDDLCIPQCMELIQPAEVIAAIERTLAGWAMKRPAPVAAAARSLKRALVRQPKQPQFRARGPQAVGNQTISVRFRHGLGDGANFARLIPLYVQRGYPIGVECTPDKALLFRAAGAEIVEHAEHTHDWSYPPDDVHTGHGRDHQGNKAGWNLSQPPLPDIGDKAALWPEYCASQVRPIALVSQDDQNHVARWLERAPRPIVLLHTKGNTGQQQKSLPDPITERLYRELLDQFDGTLVLLDWDHRVPCLAHYRVRHLSEMPDGCPTERMYALFEQSDLLVGVDSGPLHAAGLSDIPRIGVWLPGHYPARYSLPQRQQLNLVLAGQTSQWNRYRRIPWNIVEQRGHDFDPAWLANQIVRMLQPPRYLPAAQRAADVQLQQWIGEWCRGPSGSAALNSYADRNRSFDVLFRELSMRFTQPTLVETGTIRAEEDWGGAGFFTYLAGAYLARKGGCLHSVDLSPQHCDFARRWTEVFGDQVTVHCQDSVGFLQAFPDRIDALYVDSLDTYEVGHAEHALREVQAALPRLHEDSLILFDDTPSSAGTFSGKGGLAVPWLLERGWQLLYAGYQVLLHRKGG
jgi:ADP-heptose:LPS heptosyltransferase